MRFWVHEVTLERVEKRLRRNPGLMLARRSIRKIGRLQPAASFGLQ